MPQSTIRYDLDSQAVGASVLNALEERFRSRRLPAQEREGVYYDTFDWRLHRAGCKLLATGSDDGYEIRLEWTDGGKGGKSCETKSDESPRFARDLPAGALRDAVSKRIEARRLMPLVRIVEHDEVVVILDADNVAELRVHVRRSAVASPDAPESSRSVPASLHLVPLKRRSRLLDAAVGLLEREVGLHRSAGDDLHPALDAVGVRAESYSSKLEVRLLAWMRSDEAVRSILDKLLESLTANERGTRLDLDPEFLHDFRIAVRRTRALLGQLRSVFPPDDVERFRAEFSWLGKATGPTRDLDVLLAHMESYERLLPKAVRADLAPLVAFLRERRGHEHARLAECLDSPRYRELVTAWRAYVERPRDTDTAPVDAARPIVELATERIMSAQEKALRKGRAIGRDAPPEHLHGVRIACKKLRYLIELFRSLYDGEEIDETLAALKKLQDNLGDFNDLQVHRESIGRFAEEMIGEGAASATCLMATGRLAERLEDRQAKVRKKFRKLFEKFAAPERSGAFLKRIRRSHP